MSGLPDPWHIGADGILPAARQISSPNQDPRPPEVSIDLLVIHAISLPPEQFGGQGVLQLFTNTLPPDEHPYYVEIAHLKVSAHFFIRRDGALLQFVPCTERAWHAGSSQWAGRERCNDFSIGVELEGSDTQPFESAQYETLRALIASLRATYALKDIVGHADIAPGRKTDPGPFFDWAEI